MQSRRGDRELGAAGPGGGEVGLSPQDFWRDHRLDRTKEDGDDSWLSLDLSSRVDGEAVH